jgi:hypothetical protein
MVAGSLVVAGSVVTGGPAHAVTAGVAVADGADPFVVRLHIGDLRSCTGVLIDPQWILTATSCFADGGQPVAAGSPAQPTTATIGGMVTPIVRIVAHPDRGITLAKLPLRLTDAVTLPVSGTAAVSGDSVTVAGYGRTATEWVPDRLQHASATVRSTTATSLDLTGASVCKGDAGAPVLRVTGGTTQLVALSLGSQQQGCLGETGTQDGSTAVRLDDLAGWITANTPARLPSFEITYANFNGLGTFDLSSTSDQTIPFDYEHSGKQDYVLTYRPGSHYVAIAKHNPDNTFTTVYSSQGGIGGYDLAVSRDRLVPFDYDHSGKLDYLLAYRPGDRIAFAIKHNADNTFSTVWSSFGGIGGYDLADSRDQAVAFDYEHSGKLDYLLTYRPGDKIVSIQKHNADNTFSTVWSSFSGIGQYDLAVTRDRLVPFDYDHSGKLDYLLAYRPGDGIAFVVKHTDTGFATVWSSFAGLAGFSLTNTADQITPYDYDFAGRRDHLVMYRPGSRYIVIARHSADGTFSAVYSSTSGIGQYDLAVPTDRIVAFDAEHNGGANSLIVTRPGNRLFYVIHRQSAEPANPPAGTAPDAGPSIVEDGAYPGAAAIEADQHIRLISGDGHIMLADCATPPVNNVSVLKVYTTEEIGPDGLGLICFKLTGIPGLLNLEVPAVYEIRGDGQRTGFGHQVTAKVTTDAGDVQEVVVNPSGSTQVGIGTSPDAAPTTLVQLKVTG